jgi:NTP pyrophosphatase (non-canonical NTP hydrolase)
MLDFHQIAHDIDPFLRGSRPGVEADPLTVQALCVVEEAGELAGAYRRWAGLARRHGTLAEVEDETADVLLSTGTFAYRMGIDIDAAVGRKLIKIYKRGWREEDAPEDP